MSKTKFKLKYSPPTQPAPAGCRWVRLVKAYLSKSTWTARDVFRLERIIYKPSADPYDDLYDEINEQLREYNKIVKAPPLPSTAYLRRQTSLPSRESRAILLYQKIEARKKEVLTQCESLMKRYKTYKARYKERQRVHSNCPELARLVRYMEMLKKRVPDIGWIVQQQNPVRYDRYARHY